METTTPQATASPTNNADKQPYSPLDTSKNRNSGTPLATTDITNLSEDNFPCSTQTASMNSCKNMQMTEEEWQYLAGLFDLSSPPREQTESSDSGMISTVEIQHQQPNPTLPQHSTTT